MSSSPSPTAAVAGRREWAGLAVLALPTLLLAMDITVLHLAVPQLTEDLAPSSSQLLWIIDIYPFLIAGLLTTMGRLGDRIGRRRLLLIGGIAFAAASMLAAFSPNATTLILARALLGVAGATLMPSTLSLIRNMFLNEDQRTRAISIWMSSFSVGAILGPMVGGLMLEHFWWGSVFLLALPVMALLLIAGPILLPEYADPNAGRLDPLSVVLSVIAILAGIYGLKQLAEAGLAPIPVTMIVIGVIVGAVFIRRQNKLEHPLLDLALFRRPAFGAAATALTLGQIVMAGTQLFVGQYLQLVLGMRPFEAGLWMLPTAVALIIGTLGAPYALRFARRSVVMTTAATTAAAGFGLIALAGSTSGLPFVVAGLIVASLGLGPVATVSTDLVVGTAPPERAGSASAISETASELGQALGIALLGSLGSLIYRLQVTDSLPDDVPATEAEAATGTIGGALAAAERLPADIAEPLILAARESFTTGLHVVVIVCAALMLTAAVAARLIFRSHDTPRGGKGQSGPPSGDSGHPAVDGT
ncbi:MFS transporter [Ornithinimicrobium sufpigmenti]|uniref:MFS transporter n=1 Tax=Ornithinimicrobium sufpigmenti TaxID=2508882 RepID=UPI001036B84B|nr:MULTISPECIES: MFS transporter [unclassified Ornithinimicrobium]